MFLFCYLRRATDEDLDDRIYVSEVFNGNRLSAMLLYTVYPIPFSFFNVFHVNAGVQVNAHMKNKRKSFLLVHSKQSYLAFARENSILWKYENGSLEGFEVNVSLLYLIIWNDPYYDSWEFRNVLLKHDVNIIVNFIMPGWLSV